MPTEQTTATTPKTGNGQRFKFFTGATKAYIVKDAAGGPDRYMIEGIASSNARDRYGDTMSAQCQASMLEQAKGLTMFANHSYNVPEDVLGKCVESSLEAASDVIDLAIKMEIAQSNPRAMKSWELINKDETTLAFSIGGIITDAEIDEENDDGNSWWPPLIINDLELLEISLVGIPANPRAYTRSFLEEIKKSAFKSAMQNDPGVQKALLRSIGVKSVDDDFADLQGKAPEAPTPGASEVEADGSAADSVEPGQGEDDAVEASVDDKGMIGKSLEDFQREVAQLEEQRDTISADITTKTSERDALVTEIAALEEKAAKLKATPTGRQTNASTDGSLSADVPLQDMTQEQLYAHARKMGNGAPSGVIEEADTR